MRKITAIEHFGGNMAEMARRLNVTRQCVWKWPDPLPFRVQCQLEVITDGALKAERPKGTHAGNAEQHVGAD